MVGPISDKHEAVISAIESSWRKLTTSSELNRYSEIMRLMDDRYCGLSPDQLNDWRQRKIAAGKSPVLLGLFDSGNRITQVVALTVRSAENGRKEQWAFAMTGVAADELDETQITESDLVRWAGNIVYAIKIHVGCPVEMDTMRPKTMTWKPMQRVHDILCEGIIVREAASPTEVYRAGIVEENDRGHSLFWRMRLEAL